MSETASENTQQKYKEEADVVAKSEEDPSAIAEAPSKDDSSLEAGDAKHGAANEDESPNKSFPQKLMDILNNDAHNDIISWLPHGNGFVIRKKKSFSTDVLPLYFKATKFTSFTRKLNRWGFSRIPRGPETGAYFHRLFRRDKPDLCTQMTSNSGNRYQANPMQQQLLPNIPGMMGAGGSDGSGAMPVGAATGGGGTMYPFMAAPGMMNMTPQQQQALWQQQIMQLQQLQMMQMQAAQQQQQQQQQQLAMQQQQQQQQQQQVEEESKPEEAATATGGQEANVTEQPQSTGV